MFLSCFLYFLFKIYLVGTSHSGTFNIYIVGSNLARGKIFTASIGSVDSLYPSVYIYTDILIRDILPLPTTVQWYFQYVSITVLLICARNISMYPQRYFLCTPNCTFMYPPRYLCTYNGTFVYPKRYFMYPQRYFYVRIAVLLCTHNGTFMYPQRYFYVPKTYILIENK